MQHDKLVIDIETKNTFEDVGGQDHLLDLEMSFVGVYSYNQDKYFGFFEHEFKNLEPILKSTDLIVGFSSNRFDIPILNKYYDCNVKAIESLDILDEIEEKLGHRVKLDTLAMTNLKVGKTAHGLEAIKFYNEKRWDDLKNYCINDVKITRELYDLGKKQGYLMVPTNHGRSIAKVEFDWNEKIPLGNFLF